MPKIVLLILAFLVVPVQAQEAASNMRPRAPELGIKVGVLRSGPLDAITDVAGVAVGSEAAQLFIDNIPIYGIVGQ